MCEFTAAVCPIIHKSVFAGITLLSAALVGHLPTVQLLKWSGNSKRDRSGVWIGFVERSLIALFVLLGYTAETVFIFATKTAIIGYRIPTDDPSKQKKAVEYMLLGTMASYLSAVLIGFLGREIWSLLK